MKQWMTGAAIACLCVSAAGAQPPATSGQKPASEAGVQKPKSDKPAPTTGVDPSKADEAFMRQAAIAGMAEVQLGQTAAQNATNAEVKQFAQRMVADHGKSNDELKGLASQKNVTLPTELDAKHKALVDKFSKMTGDAFDKAYMTHMVSAHQQALALFQRESKSGADADAKAWAAQKVPTIQEHLKMARDINGKLAGAKGEATKK